MKETEKISLDRLNALTDGVIAIALTLLVLGIDIPEDHDFSEQGLTQFLLKLEPGLIAYLSSFIIIALYWVIHHRIYGAINYSNNKIFLLNLLYLFSISLIPFVSKIKTLYRYDFQVIVIFAFAHIVTGSVLLATWKYSLAHPELLKAPISKQFNKDISLLILVIPLVSIISILMAFVNIHIGSYTFVVLPFIYFILLNRLKVNTSQIDS